MGEFWLGAGPGQGVRVDNNVASSIAAVVGRPVVASEAYTAGPGEARWQNHPWTLKPLGDAAFCAGVNQFVFHTFAHQPYEVPGPGFTFFRWGLNFNRANTWWDHGGPEWMEYLARCQFMLRQGRPAADVLWFVGEDVPNRIGERGELSPPLPEGYDFHGADATALMEARVEDGRLRLPSGIRYRVLLLPDLPTMRPRIAERVRALLDSGAVVVAPRLPVRGPSLRDRGAGDARVRRALGDLAAASGPTDLQVGRGRLMVGLRFEEVFSRLGLPPALEWHAHCPDAAVRWTHRRVDGWNADLYFICHQRQVVEEIEVIYRDAAADPEWWDPASGEVRRLAGRRRLPDGRFRLRLRLYPWESGFLMFRRSTGGQTPAVEWEMREGESLSANDASTPPPHVELERTADGRLIARRWSSRPVEVRVRDGAPRPLKAVPPPPVPVAGPWQVRFLDERGAPDAIRIERLTCWTEHPDPGVRHYSGPAVYEVRFELPAGALVAGREWHLDLGRVEVIAPPILNERPLASLWKPPYRLRVDPHLNAGENLLRVRVTNLWPNRMIGDASLPNDVEWRATGPGEWMPAAWPDWMVRGARRESGRVTFCTRGRVYGCGDPLLPSGLLGPVFLRAAGIEEIQP